MADEAHGIPIVIGDAHTEPRELILPLADGLGRAAKATPGLLALLRFFSEADGLSQSPADKRGMTALVSGAIEKVFDELAERGSFLHNLAALKVARSGEGHRGLLEQAWKTLAAKLPSSLDGEVLSQIAVDDLGTVLATPVAQKHPVALILDVIARFVQSAAADDAELGQAADQSPFALAEPLVTKAVSAQRLAREAVSALHHEHLALVPENLLCELLATIACDRLPLSFTLFHIHRYLSTRKTSAEDALGAVLRLLRCVGGLGLQRADQEAVVASPLFAWITPVMQRLLLDMFQVLAKPIGEQEAPDGYAFASRRRATPIEIDGGATAFVALFTAADAPGDAPTPRTAAEIVAEVLGADPEFEKRRRSPDSSCQIRFTRLADAAAARLGGGQPEEEEADGDAGEQREEPQDADVEAEGDQAVATPETLWRVGRFVARVELQARARRARERTAIHAAV